MTDDPRIDPADLRAVRFPGSFRRYEARAVDEFLESVAQRIESTNDIVDDLRRQLEDSGVHAAGGSTAFTLLPREEPVFDASDAPDTPGPEPARSAMAPSDAPNLGTLSDDELVGLVGQETAHVLSTARHAADDIRSKAEESAARVIREATAESKRLVDEAEQRSVELTAEAQSVRDAAVGAAEEEGRRLRAEAEAAAEQIRVQADAEAEAATEHATRIRGEAETEAARAIEEAREEGRTMVGEAKEVRARILADLQRRRDAGRSQVERLAAGRGRLLDAYATVRANVDDITTQLDSALVEEPEPESVDLESEIDGAAAHVAAAEAERAAASAADDETDELDDADAMDDGVVDEPAPDAPAEGSATADETEADAPYDHAGVADEDGSVDERSDDHDATGDPDDGAEDDSEDGDVDALFERIRSGRAESVARAQQVLGDDEGSPPTPESEPEPESAGAQEADTIADEGGGADQVPVDMLAVGPVHEHRSEVVSKLEKSLSRALKRHLADEQNEVLDALRQTESTDAGDLLPVRDAQVGGYADVAIKGLAAAAKAGASSTDGVEADVGPLAVRLAESLVDPFRRRIEDSAADVEGDADALDERLRALYREWKVERIGPVVSDALLSAFGAGQLAAAPDGARLRWLIDPEQGPCPDAQDNALAGAVTKGESFPTGDACPQAHPGCRCLLAVE